MELEKTLMPTSPVSHRFVKILIMEKVMRGVETLRQPKVFKLANDLLQTLLLRISNVSGDIND